MADHSDGVVSRYILRRSESASQHRLAAERGEKVKRGLGDGDARGLRDTANIHLGCVCLGGVFQISAAGSPVVKFGGRREFLVEIPQNDEAIGIAKRQ